MFRITHPFHPRYGEEFVLVTQRLNWGEDRVYFHDVNGELIALPTRWTSVFAADPLLALSAGRSAFRVRDLLELAELIDSLRTQGGGR